MPARSHGRSYDRIYFVWKLMRERCSSRANKQWKDYGGRGIFVCQRWQKFENFVADMGEGRKGLTIERVDNNGPYSKRNCMWIHKSKQRINSRETHLVEHNGRKQPLSFWAKELGITGGALKYRISKYGVSKGITMPVNPKRVKAGKASVKAQGKHALYRRSKARWKRIPRVPLAPIEGHHDKWTYAHREWASKNLKHLARKAREYRKKKRI